MVVKTLPDGEGIIKMNLSREEAVKLSKENEYYGVANMVNWFGDHDCHLSEEDGCETCELLANIEEDKQPYPFSDAYGHTNL